MASLLKTQEANAADKKGKRRADDMDVDIPGESTPKRNKQRVLLLSSRGVTHRMRHLMTDLEVLLPHVKKGARPVHLTSGVVFIGEGFADSKLDSKNQLGLLPELADLHNCNNTVYFEARRHEDLYMWVAKTPNGPSIKLHVQNIHTMDELKMTGNCLKGSRGVLSFDRAFEETEWGRLTKELFTHVSGCAPCRGLLSVCLWTSALKVFGVPPLARKAKPFIDHILTFSILDSKIWFRNFQVGTVPFRNLSSVFMYFLVQIVEKDPLQPNGPPQMSLVEIGPRFVLTPIRIFEGAFGGATVYSNPGT